MKKNQQEPENQGKDDAASDSNSQDSVKLLADSVARNSESTAQQTEKGQNSAKQLGADPSHSLFHPGQALQAENGADGLEDCAEVLSQGQDAEQPSKAKRKRNKRKKKAAQKQASEMNADSNS
jgi:hypothetical protein